MLNRRIRGARYLPDAGELVGIHRVHPHQQRWCGIWLVESAAFGNIPTTSDVRCALLKACMQPPRVRHGADIATDIPNDFAITVLQSSTPLDVYTPSSSLYSKESNKISPEGRQASKRILLSVFLTFFPATATHLSDEFFPLQLRHLARLEAEAGALFLFPHRHPTFLVVHALDTPAKKKMTRNEEKTVTAIAATVERDENNKKMPPTWTHPGCRVKPREIDPQVVEN